MKIQSSAVHHTRPHAHPKFAGTVKDARWNAGMGMMPSYMGISVSVMVNPLTKTGAKVKLNDATKTITVTLSSKAGRPNQMADQKRTLEPGTPNGMSMGTKYKLVVQDTGGHVLKRTTVTPFPAA